MGHEWGGSANMSKLHSATGIAQDAIGGMPALEVTGHDQRASG